MRLACQVADGGERQLSLQTRHTTFSEPDIHSVRQLSGSATGQEIYTGFLWDPSQSGLLAEALHPQK